MRTLNEFLSTKVQNANALDGDSFPKEYDYDIIVDFLEKNGFEKRKEIGHTYKQILTDIYRLAKSSDHPLLFEYDEDLFDDKGNPYRYIRFCNCGAIDENNPIYLLRIGYDGYIPDKGLTPIASLEFNDFKPQVEIRTFEAFRKRVNEAFVWNEA